MIGLIELGLLWYAHLIGDLVFQTKTITDNKANCLPLMIAHVFIWAGTISLMLAYLEIFTPLKFVFLFVGHWIIDDWKLSQPTANKNTWHIYADQALHAIQILLVSVSP